MRSNKLIDKRPDSPRPLTPPGFFRHDVDIRAFNKEHVDALDIKEPGVVYFNSSEETAFDRVAEERHGKKVVPRITSNSTSPAAVNEVEQDHLQSMSTRK